MGPGASSRAAQFSTRRAVGSVIVAFSTRAGFPTKIEDHVVADRGQQAAMEWH